MATKKKQAVTKRAKEASSYAGLGALAAALAGAFPEYAHIATALGAVAGVVAVLLPERGGSDD